MSGRGQAGGSVVGQGRLADDVDRQPVTLHLLLRPQAEREDDGDPIDPRDPNWLLGDRQRHRGSLHQDIWRGTAAELANRGFIAVYPAKGWWRTRPAQERYGLPARYSLIVSIRTPETDVDLYTPIAQQVAAEAAVPVVVNT